MMWIIGLSQPKWICRDRDMLLLIIKPLDYSDITRYKGRINRKKWKSKLSSPASAIKPKSPQTSAPKLEIWFCSFVQITRSRKKGKSIYIWSQCSWRRYISSNSWAKNSCLCSELIIFCKKTSKNSTKTSSKKIHAKRHSRKQYTKLSWQIRLSKSMMIWWRRNYTTKSWTSLNIGWIRN